MTLRSGLWRSTFGTWPLGDFMGDYPWRWGDSLAWCPTHRSPSSNPTRAQRQMYEQTPDLDRRRRLQRLVLLPLHMGYDSSSPGEYGCRTHLQPSCARGLREAHLRPQRARGRIIRGGTVTSSLNISGTPKSLTKSDVCAENHTSVISRSVHLVSRLENRANQ